MVHVWQHIWEAAAPFDHDRQSATKMRDPLHQGRISRCFSGVYTLVSGSRDSTLRVWDLKDGKEILTFTIDVQVTACIVAQDNRTIVAGDGFGRLHFLRIVGAYETNSLSAEVKVPNSGSELSAR